MSREATETLEIPVKQGPREGLHVFVAPDFDMVMIARNRCDAVRLWDLSPMSKAMLYQPLTLGEKAGGMRPSDWRQWPDDRPITLERDLPHSEGVWRQHYDYVFTENDVRYGLITRKTTFHGPYPRKKVGFGGYWTDRICALPGWWIRERPDTWGPGLLTYDVWRLLGPLKFTPA
jgi:hypothetical protein